MKYKIGDRVKATAADVWYQAGDVGTVCEIPAWYGAASVMVKFDTPRLGDGRWYVAEKNLEKETEQ